jgi:hypothetical protein
MPVANHEEPVRTFVDVVSSETEADLEDAVSPVSSPKWHKPLKMTLHNMPIAVVLRSGFMTTRGNLTLSMLFPKPHEFHFYRDSYRYAYLINSKLGFK